MYKRQAAYGEQYKKWSFDSLPILPEEWQYTVDPDKGKQFKNLKELMHRADVSEVVNACDAGREGELIFRFVYEAAGCKKPMRRLWISSMEDGAIKAGFASLKDGRDYDALFASALCRAKADWLIGINATRLFSCLYGKTLNVGRVQTPTLKMLTDRDAAISHFQKEKYYHVRLDLSGAEAASERISDKAEADALKGACEVGKAVCVSLTREKKTAAPPKLFDLTSLQREANRIFGYTAKQTLDLAQALYEKRLLTYPRTDSSFLTDDMGDTAAGIITLLCEKLPFMAGAGFTPDIAKVLDSKKVSDHHAIIPTMELAKTDLAALPESEKNILTLAGARLLSATAEPQIFEAVTAVFSCAGTDFTAKGKTVLSDGWKEIERRYRATLKSKPDPEDGENEGVTLPELSEGQGFPNPAAKVTEHTTTPPKPHSEASLLSAMERAGNGAVSYTHLDVYKRQAGLMSSVPLGENLIPIQRGLTTSSTAIFIPFITQEPVSYTHLIRKEERKDWTRAGQNRGTSQDLKAVSEALSYLRQKGLSTVEDLEAFLESSGKSAADYRNQMKPKEARSKVIDGILASRTDCKECKAVYEKYQNCLLYTSGTQVHTLRAVIGFQIAVLDDLPFMPPDFTILLVVPINRILLVAFPPAGRKFYPFSAFIKVCLLYTSRCV